MKHRTALITAGSIAAVVFAGAIAVGANLGILTVADSRPVGQLSAATVIPATAPQPTQEYAGVKNAAASQKYIIKKAGAVKVAYTKTSVRLADVTAKRHWKWELAQTGDRKLTVTFRHDAATYTFVAVVGRHGKLTAKVDHPITKITPAASSASSPSWVASPAPSPATASSTHAGGEPQEGGEADD
ncbi:MAG: hypothetical protein ACXWW1_11280 [Aeromicrobium sp.]